MSLPLLDIDCCWLTTSGRMWSCEAVGLRGCKGVRLWGCKQWGCEVVGLWSCEPERFSGCEFALWGCDVWSSEVRRLWGWEAVGCETMRLWDYDMRPWDYDMILLRLWGFESLRGGGGSFSLIPSFTFPSFKNSQITLDNLAQSAIGRDLTS